ncbi:crossover junction endodeoxyribonuclease RuvC [Mesoaciditoga sp.]
MQNEKKRIFGVDPGFGIVGYGVIDVYGRSENLVTYGAIRTSSRDAIPKRIEKIYDELSKLLTEYEPNEAAVEELYFFRNVTTAISVGEARGVILLALEKFGIDIYEYTPMEVKLSVTSYGKATKRQVQEMVRIMLNMDDIPRPDDAADALAIALCHAHQTF